MFELHFCRVCHVPDNECCVLICEFTGTIFYNTYKQQTTAWRRGQICWSKRSGVSTYGWQTEHNIPPPHPPHLLLHKETFTSTGVMLVRLPFWFSSPWNPLPSLPPNPTSQCVIGLHWSIAADEVLWQTDRNTRGLADIKNKAESILLLWFYLSLTCCFLSISLLFNLLFVLLFHPAHYSGAALGNVILALLFVVLMYLSPPTPPLGQ